MQVAPAMHTVVQLHANSCCHIQLHTNCRSICVDLHSHHRYTHSCAPTRLGQLHASYQGTSTHSMRKSRGMAGVNSFTASICHPKLPTRIVGLPTFLCPSTSALLNPACTLPLLITNSQATCPSLKLAAAATLKVMQHYA
jgi:hypothetical protein